VAWLSIFPMVNLCVGAADPCYFTRFLRVIRPRSRREAHADEPRPLLRGHRRRLLLRRRRGL
jgi:hypothetical protein